MKLKYVVLILVLASTVFTSGCISQEKLEINSFEDCVKAGNPVMESYPPQCAVPGGSTFTEDNCQYTKGEDIFILTISDAKSIAKKSECIEVVCCEIYGYGVGMKKVNVHYEWTLSEDCTIPENFVGGGRDIVEDEYCGTGPLTEEYSCNEYTGTYWIDLDIEKEGCNPACVVNVESREAEINWRCTGLLS